MLWIAAGAVVLVLLVKRLAGTAAPVALETPTQVSTVETAETLADALIGATATAYESTENQSARYDQSGADQASNIGDSIKLNLDLLGVVSPVLSVVAAIPGVNIGVGVILLLGSIVAIVKGFLDGLPWPEDRFIDGAVPAQVPRLPPEVALPYDPSGTVLEGEWLYVNVPHGEPGDPPSLGFTGAARLAIPWAVVAQRCGGLDAALSMLAAGALCWRPWDWETPFVPLLREAAPWLGAAEAALGAEGARDARWRPVPATAETYSTDTGRVLNRIRWTRARWHLPGPVTALRRSDGSERGRTRLMAYAAGEEFYNAFIVRQGGSFVRVEGAPIAELRLWQWLEPMFAGAPVYSRVTMGGLVNRDKPEKAFVAGQALPVAPARAGLPGAFVVTKQPEMLDPSWAIRCWTPRGPATMTSADVADMGDAVATWAQRAQLAWHFDSPIRDRWMQLAAGDRARLLGTRQLGGRGGKTPAAPWRSPWAAYDDETADQTADWMFRGKGDRTGEVYGAPWGRLA